MIHNQLFVNTRIAIDLAEEDELAKALSNRTAYRFMADGGIMGGLADGQMDEMGRQMYGLGKLVKKVTRGVKKIAKSPIGKLHRSGYIRNTFGAGKRHRVFWP